MGYLWFLRCNCGNIVENLLSATETRGVGLWGGGSERPFE